LFASTLPRSGTLAQLNILTTESGGCCVDPH